MGIETNENPFSDYLKILNIILVFCKIHEEEKTNNVLKNNDEEKWKTFFTNNFSFTIFANNFQNVKDFFNDAYFYKNNDKKIIISRQLLEKLFQKILGYKKQKETKNNNFYSVNFSLQEKDKYYETFENFIKYIFLPFYNYEKKENNDENIIQIEKIETKEFLYILYKFFSIINKKNTKINYQNNEYNEIYFNFLNEFQDNLSKEKIDDSHKLIWTIKQDNNLASNIDNYYNISFILTIDTNIKYLFWLEPSKHNNSDFNINIKKENSDSEISLEISEISDDYKQDSKTGDNKEKHLIFSITHKKFKKDTPKQLFSFTFNENDDENIYKFIRLLLNTLEKDNKENKENE
ncbi:hypothetical protein [Mycoplasma zalophi]|uniref:hypothetical protein n=1 Tax=Mycoplasma zalophi TaxID=191287 RepID=UPI001C0F70C3|nr:hypothetical protein [Mycoplasma zalophi]MBU4690908.1 hypothetical protein [Mycoplasma zalophi]